MFLLSSTAKEQLVKNWTWKSASVQEKKDIVIPASLSKTSWWETPSTCSLLLSGRLAGTKAPGNGRWEWATAAKCPYEKILALFLHPVALLAGWNGSDQTDLRGDTWKMTSHCRPGTLSDRVEDCSPKTWTRYPGLPPKEELKAFLLKPNYCWVSRYLAT